MLKNKTNIILSTFKIFALKLKYRSKIKIGKRFKAKGSYICITNKKGKIKIGSSFKAMKNSIIHSDGGLIEIGHNVFINSNSIVVSRKSIKIGDNVSIGPNVCIYDHNHADERVDEIAEIKIGKGSWIGAGSIILKGVEIGDNVIIGAGSIITKNIPDDSIVVQKRVSEFTSK